MTNNDLLTTIKHFKLTNNVNSRDKILEFIYKITKDYVFFIKKERDEDIIQDILMNIMEKIENIINNFDETLSEFKTFIINVINNVYIDKKRKSNNVTKTVNYQVENTNTSYIENIADDRVVNGKKKNMVEKVILDVFTKMKNKNEEKYLVLKLIYIDLFDEEDFILLKKYTKKSFRECFEFTNEILNNLTIKQNKKKRYEDLLAHVFLNKISLAETTAEYEKLEKSQKFYLERYYSVNSNTAYSIIAEFLNVKVSNIWYFISNLKKELSKKLNSRRI